MAISFNAEILFHRKYLSFLSVWWWMLYDTHEPHMPPRWSRNQSVVQIRDAGKVSVVGATGLKTPCYSCLYHSKWTLTFGNELS